MLLIDMGQVVKRLPRTQTTVWLCFKHDVTALWMSRLSRKRSRWLNELDFLPKPFWTVSMMVAFGLDKLQISFQWRITTPRHIYNIGQRPRKMGLNVWTSVLFTVESIVCVDFTDRPVRMWISPNKRFSPFCVDINYRFGRARLWLRKGSAYKERPICTMSTTSLRQHNDTVHWSLQADVVVRHWNTVGNIVETFPNGVCKKPYPFWSLELILGSCDIH